MRKELVFILYPVGMYLLVCECTTGMTAESGKYRGHCSVFPIPVSLSCGKHTLPIFTQCALGDHVSLSG